MRRQKAELDNAAEPRLLRVREEEARTISAETTVYVAELALKLHEAHDFTHACATDGSLLPAPDPRLTNKVAWAPLQARGGVALPVEDHGGPAVAATGLPPVSSYVPTPLVEAESARPSPPPTRQLTPG